MILYFVCYRVFLMKNKSVYTEQDFANLERHVYVSNKPATSDAAIREAKLLPASEVAKRSGMYAWTETAHAISPSYVVDRNPINPSMGSTVVGLMLQNQLRQRKTLSFVRLRLLPFLTCL
jgi:hypothetical protein